MAPRKKAAEKPTPEAEKPTKHQKGTNSIDPLAMSDFVERIERMEEDIKELNESKKEIYAQAKGDGYDVKMLRKVVAIRKMDRDTREMEEEILELYLNALGMR